MYGNGLAHQSLMIGDKSCAKLQLGKIAYKILCTNVEKKCMSTFAMTSHVMGDVGPVGKENFTCIHHHQGDNFYHDVVVFSRSCCGLPIIHPHQYDSRFGE